MMDVDGFWGLVDEHLDSRRDPLDDPRVSAYLSEHADLLDRFASLTHAVGALSSMPPVANRGSTRFQRLAAAGIAVVLIALATWRFASTEDGLEIVLPDLAVDGEVMRYASRSFTTGLEGQLSLEIETGTVSILERIVLTQVEPRATTPHGHPIRTQFTKQRSLVRTERITE